VLQISREHFAPKVETRDRFDQLLEEIRQMGLESERKWAENQRRWDEQERKLGREPADNPQTDCCDRESGSKGQHQVGGFIRSKPFETLCKPC
jgi:hypothetical protein